MSIRDSPDNAAAHANQIAQSLVCCTAVTVAILVEPSRGMPKNVPPVANAWLVVTDIDAVIVAANATTERKSLKGMSLVVAIPEGRPPERLRRVWRIDRNVPNQNHSAVKLAYALVGPLLGTTTLMVRRHRERKWMLMDAVAKIKATHSAGCPRGMPLVTAP